MSMNQPVINREKMAGSSESGVFPLPVTQTLTLLCDIIIPADEKSGSAKDAGVVEFLQYVSSLSSRHFRRLVGGAVWLNAFCTLRYKSSFQNCANDQQKEVVDLIAFRRNAKIDPSLSAGIEFFAFLRREALDAFYTSRLGIIDLDYQGNQVLNEFHGCPDLIPKDEVTDPLSSDRRKVKSHKAEAV